jgi:LacI family transcriptional regulator
VAVAKLAADHLVERSFKRFGFVGFAGPIWSRQRQDAFVDQVKERGYECIVYDAPTRSRDAEWSREQVTLSEWLRSLPKPIGVMCCNDDRGRQVLEAARAGGVVVPEEVAVIGVDNDDLLCDLCDPPLSSVALNASRGGYEAAKLLDGLMSGRFKKPRTIMVEPTWVATRRSTDVLAIEDREVSQALRFIHDHVGRGVSVNELMQEQTISRRALEIRFRKAVGRSIHEEILHARVERAKRLLAETDWSNDRIAEMAGFASGSYMGQALRKALNMTPAQYRTHIRTR